MIRSLYNRAPERGEEGGWVTLSPFLLHAVRGCVVDGTAGSGPRQPYFAERRLSKYRLLPEQSVCLLTLQTCRRM